MDVIRAFLRVIALLVGIVGVIIGIIVNLTNSGLSRLANNGTTTTHGWIAFGLIVVGLIGSVVAVAKPQTSALLLAVAGIALFYPLGLLALFVSPLFFVAAILVFLDRKREPAKQAISTGR